MKLIKDYLFYGNDHDYSTVPTLYKLKNGELLLGMNLMVQCNKKKYDWDVNQRACYIRGRSPQELVERQPTMLVDYHSMPPQFQECSDGSIIAAFNRWENIELGTKRADALLKDESLSPFIGSRMLMNAAKKGVNVSNQDQATLLGYDPIKEGEADAIGLSLPIQIVRSIDQGQSWHPWSEIYDHPEKKGGTKFRGNMLLLPSGELLFVVYKSRSYASLFSSTDHGKTWHRKSYLEIKGPNGEEEYMNESSLYRHPSGRITVVSRTGMSMNLAIAHSDDDGKTWVKTPKLSETWGFPPFLLAHSSGKVLLFYYRRRTPKGLYVKILESGFSEIDDVPEIALAKVEEREGIGGGYPQAAELDDGSILVAYYDRTEAYKTYKVLGKQYILD